MTGSLTRRTSARNVELSTLKRDGNTLTYVATRELDRAGAFFACSSEAARQRSCAADTNDGLLHTSADIETFERYLQAAHAGSVEAMYRLALCYLCGLGVDADLAESRRWARECEAALNDPNRNA